MKAKLKVCACFDLGFTPGCRLQPTAVEPEATNRPGAAKHPSAHYKMTRYELAIQPAGGCTGGSPTETAALAVQT